MARMEEMDWDIILTSAHVGARSGDGGQNPTNHLWWQGQFFSRTGRTPGFPLFEESTGYGTVTGLCGANCRHSFGPGDGENNPFKEIGYEDNYKAEQLQKRQRALERRIRKTKREVMALKTAVDNATDEKLKFELDQEYQRKAALLQKQNKAYKEFCEQNGLKPLQDRIRIAKWDRQQAAAASGAAKRYNSNTVKNAAGQSILIVKNTRINAVPNSITQRTGPKGGIDRNFYGTDGKQILQISNNGHGNKREETLGNHGEHAHDYIWDSEGNLTRSKARELTEQERSDNNDFL